MLLLRPCACLTNYKQLSTHSQFEWLGNSNSNQPCVLIKIPFRRMQAAQHSSHTHTRIHMYTHTQWPGVLFANKRNSGISLASVPTAHHSNIVWVVVCCAVEHCSAYEKLCVFIFASFLVMLNSWSLHTLTPNATFTNAARRTLLKIAGVGTVVSKASRTLFRSFPSLLFYGEIVRASFITAAPNKSCSLLSYMV